MPGDYNGDGIREIAVFRPGNGLWAIRGVTSMYFGTGTDWPAPGDYDGDGTWEATIYRPAYGRWLMKGVTKYFFGNCKYWPKPGDFDGDGTDDLAVFYNTPSYLWIARGITKVHYGFTGCVPATR